MSAIAAVHAGVHGRERVTRTLGWDHVRFVEMQKAGKEVGRREVRDIGIGQGGT